MESVGRSAEDRLWEVRQLAAQIDPDRLRSYLMSLATGTGNTQRQEAYAGTGGRQL